MPRCTSKSVRQVAFIEFLMNNRVHEATILTPFEVITCQQSVIFDPNKLTKPSTLTQDQDSTSKQEFREYIRRVVEAKLVLVAERG
ncbi:hypothetical protein PR048_013406 [Dryococelus australis]|uniref:Uncharacterized protein n=1 Tax=Dryococelus australis TaxID=614101 RepID=A0ABQ9HS32_9NEOP|nr:hypothetical protein PR048_013406 [Dryococelus australis]